jgi:hypothetical protein
VVNHSASTELALISQRIARDAGVRLSARQFTAIGLALVPA